MANGGYGGTMAAGAAGAKQAGGRTIGVTCEAFGRGAANPYIDQEIRTPDLSSRLERLIELGDGYVVLPGGTGTLMELAAVWELQKKRLTSRKSVVLLGRWWEPVVELVCRDDPGARGVLAWAEDATSAVGTLAGAVGG